MEELTIETDQRWKRWMVMIGKMGASPKKRGTLILDSLSAKLIVLAPKLSPLIRVSNYPQTLIPSG
jgi:hypothetical protein